MNQVRTAGVEGGLHRPRTMRRTWSSLRHLAIAAVLAALPASACGSHPAAPQRDTRVDVLDPGGLLSALRPAIDSLVWQTVRRVEPVLEIDGVTLSIIPDPTRAIGGYGVGGYTPDGRTVQVFIDPGFPALDVLIAERIPPIVAHEMHHAKRWRKPGYGSSLLEAMVSEGMADHFARELLGTALQPWSSAFPVSETSHWLDLARPEFDSRAYSHAAWFFGNASTPPRWTGYTLGYRLVQAYLDAHPGSSATSLVAAPASAFRP